jgi:hypothetical protein
VETAAKLGITSGCGSGKFCPESAVSRGQMAAFITRTTKWPLINPGTATFPLDVPKSHLFYEEIETVAKQCVTKGCGTDMFCPDRDVTRAEAAIFVVRAFNLDGANKCLGSSGSGGTDSGGTSSGGTSNGGTSSGGTDSGGTSSGGTSSGGTDGGGTSNGGASNGGTSSGSSGALGDDWEAGGDEAGCACRVPRRSGGHGAWLAALALALSARRAASRWRSGCCRRGTR